MLTQKKRKKEMKNIFFYTLLTIIVTVVPSTAEGSKDVNNNTEVIEYVCNLEENYCIKIINKKREWCYSSQNGLNIKVRCSSDEDCVNTIECTTLSDDSQSYKSFINDRSPVSVGSSTTTTPPHIIINVNFKGIKKVNRDTHMDELFSYADGPLGPKQWPNSCLNSPEKRQSPINIITQGSIRMANWSPLKITYFTHKTLYENVYLDNYRNYLKMRSEPGSGITLEGGGLEKINLLSEVRFHFGCASDRGSEHQIDSKKYPLEVQFMFFDIDTFHSTNVAVLFEEGDLKDNNTITFDTLDEAINIMGYNIDDVAKITNDVEKLFEGLLPDDMKIGHRNYFKYRGSLTTPPCSDADWFVLADSKHKVPAKFLKTLRKLHSSMGRSSIQNNLMCDNFRPIQKNKQSIFLVTKQ
ncbi:carbonic anhydrase 5B, mitochondrial-like [Hydra vulgaris]|uniref:Carbonic anhydrase 5B, mitochondrial-like n=1 Tax=Hydra vulgaris TaxID=6087 RepID=A0ABM4D8A5_HYDVU